MAPILEISPEPAEDRQLVLRRHFVLLVLVLRRHFVLLVLRRHFVLLVVVVCDRRKQIVSGATPVRLRQLRLVLHLLRLGRLSGNAFSRQNFIRMFYHGQVGQ